MTGRQSSADDKALGDKLRVLRRERGLSLQELASKIGIAYQQLQKYEKGQDRVSFGRLREIADGLELNVPTIVNAVYGGTGEIIPMAVLSRQEIQLLREFRRLTAEERANGIANFRSINRYKPKPK